MSEKRNNVHIAINPPVDIIRYWERKEDKQEVMGILCALEVDTSNFTDEQVEELKQLTSKKVDSKELIDWLYKVGKWHVMEQGVESYHKKWKDVNVDHYVKELYEKDRVPIWYNRIFLALIVASMSVLTLFQLVLSIINMMAGNWGWGVWDLLMTFWDAWCLFKVMEGVRWFWYRRGFKQK